MKLALILGVTLIAQECAPVSPAQMKARQEVADLCEKRGGIPILNEYGDNILRCDFPPTVRPPEVER